MLVDFSLANILLFQVLEIIRSLLYLDLAQVDEIAVIAAFRAQVKKNPPFLDLVHLLFLSVYAYDPLLQ